MFMVLGLGRWMLPWQVSCFPWPVANVMLVKDNAAQLIPRLRKCGFASYLEL